MSIAEYDSVSTSTDELLRTTAQTYLGAEAANRVLVELQQRDLRDRAAFLVRAAEFLEMFGEQAPKHASAAGETRDHTVVPIHTVQEAVLEPTSTEEVPSVETPRRELLGERAEVATKEVVSENAEREDQFRLDTRMQGLLEKIYGKEGVASLNLTSADRDAVAATLLEMRGRLDARMKPDVVLRQLGLTFDGIKSDDIGAELSIPSAAAVQQRWYKLRDGIIANIKKQGIDPVAVLSAHRGNGLDVSVSDNQGVASEITTVGEQQNTIIDLGQPESHERVTERPGAKELQSGVDFGEVLERFCLSDEALATSIQDLLTEVQYDADTMSRGREVLADLVGRYARDGLVARVSLQGDSDGVYRALKDLAGISDRSNSLPRTLYTILKYKQGVTYEQVEDSLGNLLDYALAQGYNTQSVAAKRNVGASPHMMPLKQPEQKLVTPVQYSPGVDLFAIATGELRVGAEEWEVAAEALFDELLVAKKLTKTQVEMLKMRVLGEDKDKNISTEMKELLTLLQKQSKEPGARIDESPEVRRVFDQFTQYIFGAQTVEDIARREGKLLKRRVSERTVKRQLVGGIATVLEDR